MGLIREPLEVDLYTAGKELTKEDHKRVSDYIQRNKKTKAKKAVSKKVQDKPVAHN